MPNLFVSRSCSSWSSLRNKAEWGLAQAKLPYNCCSLLLHSHLTPESKIALLSLYIKDSHWPFLHHKPQIDISRVSILKVHPLLLLLLLAIHPKSNSSVDARLHIPYTTTSFSTMADADTDMPDAGPSKTVTKKGGASGDSEGKKRFEVKKVPTSRIPTNMIKPSNHRFYPLVECRCSLGLGHCRWYVLHPTISRSFRQPALPEGSSQEADVWETHHHLSRQLCHLPKPHHGPMYANLFPFPSQVSTISLGILIALDVSRVNLHTPHHQPQKPSIQTLHHTTKQPQRTIRQY